MVATGLLPSGLRVVGLHIAHWAERGETLDRWVACADGDAVSTRSPFARFGLLLAVTALGSTILTACAGGGGIQPIRATATSFAVEPAVNTPSTTTADGADPVDPAGDDDPTGLLDFASTSTLPEPSDPDAPTSTVPGGDDGSDDETTTTTAAEDEDTTTTTAAAPAAASLPTTATVQRMTWTGAMDLSAVQEDGSIGTTSGVVSGFHVGPDRHRTEYVETSTLTSQGGIVLGERTMEWVVGVVNDRAWFEQDGDVEEMDLGQAHRFVPYLSSALEGVVPSDAILADLAGRPGSDVTVLGRSGRKFVVDNADVELYAPVFLRYTPALYGTSGSGSVAGVEVVIDLQTGAALSGSLTLSGETAAGGEFDMAVEFTVTAVDDRSIQVLIPG